MVGAHTASISDVDSTIGRVFSGGIGAYGVAIPDMPRGCCAMGSTVDEALAHAKEALADWVKMLESRRKSSLTLARWKSSI